jgi:hypothetical protein
MLVRHVVALHRPSASCTRGSNASPTVGTAFTCIFSRISSICFMIRLTPDRSCSADPFGLQRQLEVVQHRQKLFRHAAGRILAILGPLALRAFARIFKLRLQPCQPIQQLIALRLQLIESPFVQPPRPAPVSACSASASTLPRPLGGNSVDGSSRSLPLFKHRGLNPLHLQFVFCFHMVQHILPKSLARLLIG